MAPQCSDIMDSRSWWLKSTDSAVENAHFTMEQLNDALYERTNSVTPGKITLLIKLYHVIKYGRITAVFAVRIVI
jgi:hypothetical protein